MKDPKVNRYVILGDPTALARTRVTATNRVWDSQKQIKLAQGIQLANQHNEAPLLSGPLHMNITFYMAIAPSTRKKNIVGSYHYFRPDLDNLVKFVCDIATGIIYHEDCIISSLIAKKIYDDEPRTVFYITEVKSLGGRPLSQEKV